MMVGGRRVATCLAFGIGLAMLALPEDAEGFCGFYVSGADAKLFNDATQVVLMRDGTRTVLSMQNDYKGPPENFALVVPVPVILQKENVKTLEKSVFERIDALTSPRLVEYWEEDPCPSTEGIGLGNIGTLGHGAGSGTGMGFGNGHGRTAELGVKVEAQFSVGEYDISILSAKDSNGLDTWLRENQYKIPAGAGEALKPYVASGQKFFVAKVDVTKVKFDNGRAALSPLRFHYDSEKLELPVKLGLLNSSGTQDLIVYVIGRERYEVANFANVTIPTNIDVSEKARTEFGTFYSTLYDRTVEQHPNSVVTEYAWGATSCDPCPGDVFGMTGNDVLSLGADVMPNMSVTATSRSNTAGTSPTLRQGQTTVSSGLPPEVVQRIVRQNFGRFRLCYENALKSTPTLQGRVVVNFDISPDGDASNAKDGGSELQDASMMSCMVKAFSGLSFPPPENKKKVSVSYPIIFTPPERTATQPVASTVTVTVNTPLVVTRLHARYGKGALGQDLVFRVADPIVGGRELWSADGTLDHGAKKGDGLVSSFQARYAIRHPWTGPIACKEPVRNHWGGPWPSVDGGAPKTETATKLGLIPHGQTKLESYTQANVGELAGTALGAKDPDAGPSTAKFDTDNGDGKKPSSRCGCRAVGEPTSNNPFGVLLLGMLASAAEARRRSRAK